jgi:hypothetical protein
MAKTTVRVRYDVLIRDTSAVISQAERHVSSTMLRLLSVDAKAASSQPSRIPADMSYIYMWELRQRERRAELRRPESGVHLHNAMHQLEYARAHNLAGYKGEEDTRGLRLRLLRCFCSVALSAKVRRKQKEGRSLERQEKCSAYALGITYNSTIDRAQSAGL